MSNTNLLASSPSPARTPRQPRPIPAALPTPDATKSEASKPGSVAAPPLLVLKLGGSILTSDADLSRATTEIYRHLRRGTKVIAVVSALFGTTDRLLARAKRITADPDAHTLAALLSTGEITSAALLALACQRAGIPARMLDPAQLKLRAEGDPLDASPTSIETAAIDRALLSNPVLIVPGFIARDANNNTVLLGRGGSDLTALFLAHSLSAPCRLLKDVPGVFESDPNRTERREPPASEVEGGVPATWGENGIHAGGLRRSVLKPRRYINLSLADLTSLNAKVVQPRTAVFASRNHIAFEVGAPYSDTVTRISHAPSRFHADHQPRNTREPLRVALLGHGTVGAGVAQALRRHSGAFQLTSIAVRQPEKHFNRCLPRRLFTTSAAAAIPDCDVVIELIGGIEPARTLIAQSLAAGRHVITANKAVIAKHGRELRALAAENRVQLLCSAAVGGALPVLETARRLHASRGLASIEAILNGATNYILTRVEQSIAFSAAIAEAQVRGLTEADPTRDLCGQDALDKLNVIAQELWPEVPIQTRLDPLSARPGPGTRQVARLFRRPHFIQLQVAPEVPLVTSPLSRCAQEDNAAIFTTTDGCQTLVTGKGAGRYPTTESVLADLFDLARESGLTSASC